MDLGGCSVQIMQTKSPHTDDATIVYVVEDKTLFLGDATCDEFETGIKRKDLCQALADKIRSIDPEICVEGHWIPIRTEETLSDLLN